MNARYLHTRFRGCWNGGTLALLAGASTAAAQQARLYLIADLPHPTSIRGTMNVKAVTDNGVVVGAGSDMNAEYYNFGDTSFQAIRYSVDTGESVALGKLVSAMNSSGGWVVSADGSQVFGVSSTQLNAFGVYNSRPYRWTAQSGMVQLPIIPGDPSLSTYAGIRASTPDGSLLVGGSGTTTTYRWTVWPVGAAPYQFPDPVHTVFGELEGISDDAQTAFGSGAQTGLALIWRAGAPALVSLVLPGGTHSQATAMSGDGLTFVGSSDTVYQGNHIQHVFRYRTDTGVVDLSLLFQPGSYHNALGVTHDGNTVLGIGATTWIWRASRGMTDLNTYLTQELGLSLTGLLNPYGSAISPSGRYIAGQATDPTGQEDQIAWVVDTGAPAQACYANCDGSTAPPILNTNDFQCFMNKFAAGDSYANCDGSTNPPVLNVNDFQCFVNKFAAGCS
jgi:hypothetical protein